MIQLREIYSAEDGKMHEGHRKRVKDKFRAYGQDIFEDHELLELLLFFGISRKNTNGIAHELLNRFGSLQGVFDASTNELIAVDGIGRSSAVLIKTVGAFIQRCRQRQPDNRLKLDSFSEITRFVGDLFEDDGEERIYLIALNSSFRLIGYSNVCTGEINFSSATIDKIVKTSFDYNASFVIVAHNHPGGIAIPSQHDVDATTKLTDSFRYLNICFLEHFIIAGGRCNPIIHGAEAHSDKAFDRTVETLASRKKR